MADLLAPRGPDSSGLRVIGRIALSHRRLSIIDLSDAGSQPMELHRHGIYISYNGEIYNFGELKNDLRALGSKFNGNSDTEVILQAYATWGLDGLRKLEGIFGFALWDEPRQRLVLMRDRLGVKPVYYGETKLGLAFASEIKAVRSAELLDPGIDDQALREFLWYGNSYEERTFYRGIRSLNPGCWLIDEPSGRRLEPWWRVEDWMDGQKCFRDFDVAVSQVRMAVDGAVSRQMVSDVPLAILLSGGIDSSAIAASAVRSQAEPVLSYSAGFDFAAGVNELPKAALVAKHLGLKHQEIRVSGACISDAVLRMAEAHDEPFADAANLPLYLISEALNGAVKVVLQGDGGDELFGGYRRYSLLRNERFWKKIPNFVKSLANNSGDYGRRFARLANCVGHDDMAMRMALLLTTEVLDQPPELLFESSKRAHLVDTTDPFLAYRRAAQRFSSFDSVQQMMLTDLTVQLPSQFLTKVDRATMASGVEARVPLLDEKVAELALGLPTLWKVSGLEKKIILRASQRGRLPDSILDAPKTGFGVPYQYWLRTSMFDFCRDRLLDTSFLKRFSLRQVAIEEMLAKHKNGTRDFGFLLWKVMHLQIWHSNNVGN